jgi:mannose-6-phosphate isomerase-like protein (cupin superfamily)
MRFKSKSGRPFESPNVQGRAFNSFDEFPEMSAAEMRIEGWHGLVKAQATRCFYVVEGEGLFLIAGREYRVAPGDVVMVPRLMPHDIHGDLRLFVVHSPSFHPDMVQWLE